MNVGKETEMWKVLEEIGAVLVEIARGERNNRPLVPRGAGIMTSPYGFAVERNGTGEVGVAILITILLIVGTFSFTQPHTLLQLLLTVPENERQALFAVNGWNDLCFEVFS